MPASRLKKLFSRILLVVIACLIPMLFGLLSPGTVSYGFSVKRNYLPLLLRDWPPPSPTIAPGRLLISEVLYDPVGAEPDGEWVEIYNAGGMDLDLSGYKIGDEETAGGQEGMFRFPMGSAISPGQSFIIASQSIAFQAVYGQAADFEFRESDPSVPTLTKYTPWASGNVEFVNTGDEVFLLDGLDRVIDAVSWGNSNLAFDPPVHKVAEGHSLERRPAYKDTDRAEDWVDQAQPGPWAVNIETPTPTISPTFPPTETSLPSSTPSPTITGTGTQFPQSQGTGTPTPTGTSTYTPSPPPYLLISEVSYHPPGIEPDEEWIEIYNAGAGSADLSLYRLGDEETQGGSEGMLWFPPGSILDPGKVAVIANKAAAFRNLFGFNPDFEMTLSDASVPLMEPDRSWANGSLNLSNSGDEVLLLGPGGEVIDALSWGSSIWAFYPSIAGVTTGHTLERWPANHDSDSAADWLDQSSSSPGSVATSVPTPTDTVVPTSSSTPTATGTLTSTTPSLLLSEVYCCGSSGGWIEIYNAGEAEESLSGYRIGDEETPGGSEGMFQFPDGALISAGQAVVIANQADVFSTTYGFEPDYEIVNKSEAVPDMLPDLNWGTGIFFLKGSDDEVLLMDPSYSLLDAVSWGSSTWAFSPSAPAIATGTSLERRPANRDTDSAADWFVQTSPAPGQVDLSSGTPPWLGWIFNWRELFRPGQSGS